MDNEAHPFIAAVVKSFVGLAGTVGTVTLAQFHLFTGILVGLFTLVFIGLQVYVLWRDKIIKYRPNTRTRSTDNMELDER